MFQSVLQADTPPLTADNTDGPLSLCLSRQPSSSLPVIDATVFFKISLRTFAENWSFLALSLVFLAYGQFQGSGAFLT